MPKISQLTTKATPADADLLAVVDVAAGATKATTVGGIAAAVLNQRTISQTLTAGQQFVSYRVQGSTGTLGPAVISYGEPLFNGDRDPSVGVGVNATVDGVLVTVGKAGLSYNLENNYNDGSGANKQEMYGQFVGSNGTFAFRPWFAQHNVTTNTVATLVAGDSVTIGFPTATTGLPGYSGATFSPNSLLLLAPNTGANNTLALRAASGWTSILSLGSNAVDNFLQIYPSGNAAGIYLNSQPFYFFCTPAGAAAPAMSIGANENGACITLQPAHNFYKALVARKKSGNSNNIVEFQDSDTTTLFLSLNSSGKLSIGNGGTPISKYLSATTTWDAASVADGAMTSTTVTVTGAALGDAVAVGHTIAVPAGCILSGSVTSSNTVTVTLFNKSGGAVDLASGTLRASVIQH